MTNNRPELAGGQSPDGTGPLASAALLSRRGLMQRLSTSLSAAAFATLVGRDSAMGQQQDRGALADADQGLHHAAKAKRVVVLFQSGAPSQLDLFDHKPQLRALHESELPDSIRKGQRLTGMTATQTSFPIAASRFRFRKHGESGVELSELLPHTAKIADELCVIRSMWTEAINHDPAITFCQTGNQLAGRPSLGAWLAYGLGSANENLPAFIAMVSGSGGQPLYDRLWGSGFLPTRYQGVKFRSVGDPVPFLSRPPGIDPATRRLMLDDLAELNRMQFERSHDPEILTRVAQYEMAFRMQSSVPELTDVSDENESTFELYGEQARQPGSFAHNCLLSRRLLERGVRFVQLFHRGWDQHRHLPVEIAKQTQATDQGAAALVRDLQQRGLLEDTLVVWCGEFGRTVYCQGALTHDDYGRDHHPRCFSIWMAGAGVRSGYTHGQTDDFGYNIERDPVSVHDLHATMLHLLGIDHERLTFRFQGRDYRLTDVHGKVVTPVIS